MTNKACERILLKVPNAVVAIDQMLSKDQKVRLYITVRKEDGGYYETKWKNIFLRFFGTNTDFSIVDRPKLDNTLKEEHGSEISGIMPSDKDLNALKQAGVTHMFIINGVRSYFITAKITGNLIDIETAKIISTDEVMD